jgi:HK97 gp10 family phage protein
VQLGYSANDPLLRTGEMRESIEYNMDADGREAYVGTNNEKAVFNEFGTSKIPPRSFLGGAVEHKGQECADATAEILGKAFMSRR